MKGCIVRNRYYTDGGMEYVFRRLTDAFGRLHIATDLVRPILSFENGRFTPPQADFAVFWDKDVTLCRAMERAGLRCFNTADAIAACDDKAETYARLSETGLPLADTVTAPLMYPASDTIDEAFIARAESLGFPLIVKDRVGSRGEQVFLLEDDRAFRTYYRKNKHTPFLCQRFIAASKGRDVRVYVIGGQAAGAISRTNEGFKSNAFAGATAARTDGRFNGQAEQAAAALGLDYCAVDFTADGYLLEVNSNAYFTAAEELGLTIADTYASYIAGCVYGRG